MNELEEAARKVASGDATAFRSIVEATSARLVRLSARMLGSVTEAEDVVQEAYVKAYEALVAGAFDFRSQVATWLHRIVVNATLDARRRAKARPRPAASEASDVADDAGGGFESAPAAEARLALKELAAWLDALPEEQQAVLVMKVVEGMSSAEIADVLQTTEGAVEQRLVRARATLRERRGS